MNNFCKSKRLHILLLFLLFCVVMGYNSYSQVPGFPPNGTAEQPPQKPVPSVPAENIPPPPPGPEKKEPAASADVKKDTPAKAAQKLVDKKQKYFTLNFKDVDISEFLNIMSQLINKNIIIDEKVRGKITISSAKKIPVAQAYDVLKAILEVKGFSLVETENLIKVLPIKDAIKKNVEVIIDSRKKKKTIPAEDDKTITYLVEMEFADSNEIANVLRALKSNNTDIVTYYPLNNIILSGTASEIHGLAKIAKALDKKAEDMKELPKGTGNIHVVHLENADAEQLGNVLARIPFSESAKIDTSPISSTQPTMPPTQTYNPSDRTSRTMRTQGTSPLAKQTSKLSIIANKETNSLIITAAPDEFREILRIIKELDIVREQVLIEALIVEISADNGWGFGVDWMLGHDFKQVNGALGGSNIGKVPDYSTTSIMGRNVALPLTTGLQLGFLGNTSPLAFILLNASGTDNNFNVLSTPQILTVDNQEAEMNVGQEIAVPTSNRISDTSNTQYISYEYKSVGVKLKITPHITKKENITMDVYQEVNQVIGDTTISSGTLIPPKLGKRDIKTKITVADGKTIVIGGLIKNEKNVAETKIPVLGDIPLLGWLFKRKTVSNSKTNLLVFITPHIMTKQEKYNAVTEQKIEEQRRLLKFK